MRRDETRQDKTRRDKKRERKQNETEKERKRKEEKKRYKKTPDPYRLSHFVAPLYVAPSTAPGNANPRASMNGEHQPLT